MAALAVLLGLSSLTPRRLLQLAVECGSAARCLEAVQGGEAASDADRLRARSLRGTDVLESVERAGARLVAVGSEEYPGELLDLFDPPAGLFLCGRPLRSLAPQIRIAIVGARNCSPAGREIASNLAAAVARAGVCVVSGGARGIDAAGHDGALRAGGTTIAVLGSGIDVAYPRQNARLLRDVSAAGAVVSEYPPGVPAEPFRFPARNRIVAAMASAVVVVEGAEGSGSLITADHALDLGREVFAVPGPVWSPLAQVPLGLIRDGATLIRGADDLLEDLGLAPAEVAGEGTRPAPGVAGADVRTSGASACSDRPDGATHDQQVWEGLVAPATPDRIAASCRLPLPTVLAALVSLELRGLVVRAGGRFERRPGAKWC